MQDRPCPYSRSGPPEGGCGETPFEAPRCATRTAPRPTPSSYHALQGPLLTFAGGASGGPWWAVVKDRPCPYSRTGPPEGGCGDTPFEAPRCATRTAPSPTSSSNHALQDPLLTFAGGGSGGPRTTEVRDHPRSYSTTGQPEGGCGGTPFEPPRHATRTTPASSTSSSKYF